MLKIAKENYTSFPKAKKDPSLELNKKLTDKNNLEDSPTEVSED